MHDIVHGLDPPSIIAYLRVKRWSLTGRIFVTWWSKFNLSFYLSDDKLRLYLSAQYAMSHIERRRFKEVLRNLLSYKDNKDGYEDGVDD